jgi:hypothetical protein
MLFIQRLDQGVYTYLTPFSYHLSSRASSVAREIRRNIGSGKGMQAILEEIRGKEEGRDADGDYFWPGKLKY